MVNKADKNVARLRRHRRVSCPTTSSSVVGRSREASGDSRSSVFDFAYSNKSIADAPFYDQLDMY